MQNYTIEDIKYHENDIFLPYRDNPKVKKVGSHTVITPERGAEILKCMEDPIYFCENFLKLITLDYGLQPFKPRPYQVKTINTVIENRNVICKWGRQPCFVSTLVKIPNGYKELGDIKTGDIVIGSENRPTKVLSITENYDDNINVFEINIGGTLVKTDSDHIWTVNINGVNEELSTLMIKKAITQTPVFIPTLRGFAKVFSVKETKLVPVKCIEVDAPDGLYCITENDILTHNSGKTATIAAVIVWILLFNKNKEYEAAILAHKQDQAIEIMDRIKLYYENLPLWFQKNVKTWNKKTLELEGNAKAFAAATSSGAVRGRSLNFAFCLNGTEGLNVLNKETNLVDIIPIKDIFLSQIDDAVRLNSNQIITSNKQYQILTPEGYRDFKGIIKQPGLYPILNILFDDKTSVQCTPEHPFYINNTLILANELKQGDLLDGSTALIQEIKDVDHSEVYSPYNILSQDHRYLLINNKQTKNCDEFALVENQDEFFTGTFPTISSGKDSKFIIASCVAPDTMVFTDKGIKTVEDFADLSQPDHPKRGYEIESYQVAGKMTELNRGNVIVNSGLSKTKKIKLTHTDIHCSDNHKLYAYQAKTNKHTWVKAEDLQIGDAVAVRYGMNIWGGATTVDYKTPATDWRTQNRFEFDKEISPAHAYLLGMYVGDGCVYKTKSQKSLHIASEDDISFAFNNAGVTCTKWGPIAYRANSVTLVEFILACGFDISLGSRTKVIPKQILCWSEELIASFISGLFDADGHCSKSLCRTTYVSTSEKLVDQVRMILLNFGILCSKFETITPANTLINVESKGWTLEISNHYHDMFHDIIGFKIPRKRDSYIPFRSVKIGGTKDIINNARELIINASIDLQHIEHNNFRYSKQISRGQALQVDPFGILSDVFSPDIVWSIIKEIEDSESKVYDFSLDHIEGDKWCHSVLYNGAIGHQTPKGFNLFYKLWKDAEEGKNDFIPLSINWWDVPGRDEAWKKGEIARTSEALFSQEYEATFLGSSNTLIAGLKLGAIPTIDPVMTDESKDHLHIFIHPQPGHKYLICADVSEGVGGDSSSFIVVDVSTLPYTVVASYDNDMLDPLMYPNVLYDVGTFYNTAYIAIESNTIGHGVVNSLYMDLEYENIISSNTKNKMTDDIMEGGRQILGIRQTKKTKHKGNSTLKTLIENDQFILNDFRIFYQLSRYIKKGSSFAAEAGEHDDLVMCLVLFAYITSLPTFKDITGTDLTLALNRKNLYEQQYLPFGVFVDNGLSNDNINSFAVLSEFDQWLVD